MKRLLCFGVLFAGVLIFISPVQANLLSFGDFTGASINSSSGGFNPSTGSPTDVWIGNSTWQIVTDNNGVSSPSSDTYAKHTDNSRVRLIQGIDASGLSNGLYSFNFDYIYQTGFTGIDNSNAVVLGVNSSDPLISQFPTSNDGFPPDTWDWDVLYSKTLAIDQSNLVSDWTHVSDTFSLASSYDYLAIVFTSSASANFAPFNAGGLRAVDNVELNSTPVPEPTTMLLLTTGLVGLAGFSRKKIKKSY